MAKKATVTEDVQKFGPSPYPEAEQLRAELARRKAERDAERAARRKMTSPHVATSRADRPNLLRLPDDKVRELEKKGLEACWVTQEQYDNEYAQKGYVPATRRDFGEVRTDFQDDTKGQDTVITRREMICIIGPKDWRNQRMELAQNMDRIQRDKDPMDELERRQRAGAFGKGSRVRRAIDDDEDDDE